MVCSCTSVTCSVTVSVVTPPFCPGLQGKCAVQSFDTDTQSLCAMIENIMFTKYDTPIEAWFQEQHGQTGEGARAQLPPALRSHFMHPVRGRCSCKV